MFQLSHLPFLEKSNTEFIEPFRQKFAWTLKNVCASATLPRYFQNATYITRWEVVSMGGYVLWSFKFEQNTRTIHRTPPTPIQVGPKDLNLVKGGKLLNPLCFF